MTDTDSGLRTYRGGVAVVTGGASGIGKALGEELAARGCDVILADLDGDAAEVAAEHIRGAGGSATAATLDVTDAGAFEALLQDTRDQHGRLDYLFNNAGIALNGKFRDFELSHWRRVIDINLLGVVHGMKAAYTHMSEQGFGHIVNTASFAGLFPWPTTMPYTATKHAIVGMSCALRAELAAEGIRVSVLCPGTILTPMIEKGASPERWVGSYAPEKLEAFFGTARGMQPDAFARKSLDQVARNKRLIVLPGAYKSLWLMNRLSPAISEVVATQIYQAIMKRIDD